MSGSKETLDAIRAVPKLEKRIEELELSIRDLRFHNKIKLQKYKDSSGDIFYIIDNSYMFSVKPYEGPGFF